MLAWWGSLNLSGFDAYRVLDSPGAPGERYRQKDHKTSRSPLSVVLVSKYDVWRFWAVRFGISGLGGRDILGLRSVLWV